MVISARGRCEAWGAERIFSERLPGMKSVIPKRGGYFSVMMLPRVGEQTQQAA